MEPKGRCKLIYTYIYVYIIPGKNRATVVVQYDKEKLLIAKAAIITETEASVIRDGGVHVDGVSKSSPGNT